MPCNSTLPAAEVCGGIGQCVEDLCVCPKGYAVLHDCEVTHYAVEPTAALVISCIFFFPYLIFSILCTYEYVWWYIRRPSMRWSRLQIFELMMIFFAYTRLWGTVHYMINSQIGHTRLWGSPARELTYSLGFAAILIGMAMVVSLCYDMVISVQRLDSNKTRTSRYVNLTLLVGGIITTIVMITGAIYGLFLKTQTVSLIYTGVSALYAIVFLVLGIYSVVVSRKLWHVADTHKHRATFEFRKKVKIMISWNVTGTIYIIVALFFNVSDLHESIFYFISNAVYLFIELTLGCLSLAFNQHYLYPFKGLYCCDPDVGVSSESITRSRYPLLACYILAPTYHS
eukprot:TRINITY_DN956_c0_g1_i1.p1 TRINITY_DN956_c0_g1~~TRINITY_DN956_c0_g1_i1.p1  ORF type:complete len:364 (-),score=40.23 TRINITY_DN956_c0_g1_i1:698-1720(-)